MYKRHTFWVFSLHSELVSGRFDCTLITILNRKQRRKDNGVRKKSVLVRMNQAEYDALYLLYNQSTCRTASEWFRSAVLKKQSPSNTGVNLQMKFVSLFLRMENELNVFVRSRNNIFHELHVGPDFRVSFVAQAWWKLASNDTKSWKKFVMNCAKFISYGFHKIFQIALGEILRHGAKSKSP